MHDRRTTTEHDKHDRVLVARFAAGDAYPAELVEAQLLIDRCDECAALASDIALISARTSELPPIRRPRDFRISPEQADKLRGSWFDRLMRGFSNPGWSVVRPLAGASLAIGLALVVVGALPLGSLSGGSALEVTPGISSQLGGVPPTSNAFVSAPQAPSTSEHQLDASSASVVPAASTGASKAGGESTALPGTAVENGGSPPANSPTTPDGDLVASSQPAPEFGSSPSAVLASAAPTPEQAFAAPTMPPTPAPRAAAPVSGQPSSPDSASGAGPDKPTLVVLGMIIALLSVLVLGLAIVARRRYSDPLVR